MKEKKKKVLQSTFVKLYCQAAVTLTLDLLRRWLLFNVGIGVKTMLFWQEVTIKEWNVNNQEKSNWILETKTSFSHDIYGPDYLSWVDRPLARPWIFWRLSCCIPTWAFTDICVLPSVLTPVHAWNDFGLGTDYSIDDDLTRFSRKSPINLFWRLTSIQAGFKLSDWFITWEEICLI